MGSATDETEISAVCCGDPLHGERDNLLRLAIAVALGALPDLAELVGRVGVGLLFEPLHEFRLRLGDRHPGQVFEAAAFVTDHLVELGLFVGNRLLLAAEFARPAAQVLVALFEDLELAVEGGLLFDDAALLGPDLFAAAASLGLPVFAEPDQLFLAGEDGGLAQCIRLPRRLGGQFLRGLLGRLAGRFQLVLLGLSSSRSSKRHPHACAHDGHAAREGERNHIQHWIYAPARRRVGAAARGKPRLAA